MTPRSAPNLVTSLSKAAGEPGKRATPIAAQNIAALRQGLALFERLGSDRYGVVVPRIAHSGVGGHFRHIHDYYRCFLAGVDNGRVDYDARERDARFETDLDHAAAGVHASIALLEALDAGPDRCTIGERELLVKMDAEPGEVESALWSRSTLRRELRFLLSHTIHHYALIRVVLRADGVPCDESFGVAPSTLDYWEQSERCAPSPGSGA